MEQESLSPESILEILNGHQRTATLKAAIDVELFTAIQEGCHETAALAKRCQASERGIRMLADTLTLLGLLQKNSMEYRLTPESEKFLVKTAPTYVGGTVDFMLSPPMYDGFRRLTEAVRTGKTALKDQGTITDEHPEWVTFARAMIPMMMPSAKWIAEYVVSQSWPVDKVLDIAAGHGIFGIEIAKRFPKANIVVVDWPNVLEVAMEQAQAAGVDNRYSMLPGNAFEVDYGEDYDVILVTNFLHHFDPQTCEGLLRKLHSALNEHGRVITLEFVPHEDRVSPASADFALVMLATTPAGDAYTFKELNSMFTNAGFGQSEIHDIPDCKEHVIVTPKN